MVFRALAESEGYKVALEIVVAAYRAVGCDYQQFLVFRPPQALDSALVPL
jgi:hypothetical protein